MNDNKKTAKSVRWQKIGLSILCVFLALVLLVMIFATAFLEYAENRYLDKINRVDINNEETNPSIPTDPTDPDFTGPVKDPTDVEHNTVPPDQITDSNSDGLINILLVGQDRRPGQGRQRSDSMILCSFNVEKGTISMTSFLRDTYVYIPGWGSEKLNAAYAHGGFKLLYETLAVNFGVSVDAGVEVDFSGFKQIIDLLGGVDISLTQKEVDHLNKWYKFNLSVGPNHLNGEQALAYSRIRKIDMDAMRAQRQRTVLLALIDKYKSKSISEMLDILDDVLPMVTTTMSNQEIINYAVDLFPMLSNTEIKTQQIPAAGTYTEMTVGSVTATKVADMEVNRQILKDLLGN
ncbi:MAG: LCP family protein [Oscillospiraceae bacterium]|nr:LCP family protein [Oscillospiraceae bacterium]